MRLQSKKKVFYRTIKGSFPGHTGRSFFGFVKRRFRMELFPGVWEKWFRTQGSVRNLYREQTKRFRTKGFVPTLYSKMPKWFRTKWFAPNLARIVQLVRNFI